MQPVAAAQQTPVANAQFEKMKTLVGDWEFKRPNGTRLFDTFRILDSAGWARLFGISRIRTSGTNVNDYRGSVGVAGYLCVPRQCRPRVAVSAMPQCEDIGRHPCSHVGADFRMVRYCPGLLES